MRNEAKLPRIKEGFIASLSNIEEAVEEKECNMSFFVVMPCKTSSSAWKWN
jgi:hypothetical protein